MARLDKGLTGVTIATVPSKAEPKAEVETNAAGALSVCASVTSVKPVNSVPVCPSVQGAAETVSPSSFKSVPATTSLPTDNTGSADRAVLASAMPVFAALDLGTNNCRLMIATAGRRGFQLLETFSRIVRLGEGLGQSGSLSEEAMSRTLAALKICAEKMARRGAVIVRAVATEACRRAANGTAFLARVQEETGIALEIVAPEEEARLARLGCRPLFDHAHSHVLVFDIGGGSTELNWLRLGPGREPETLGWMSLPHGVVTIAEQWGGARMSLPAYDRAMREMLPPLRAFAARYQVAEAVRRGTVQLLGTSGTVTTLAGVHLGLKRYDRLRVDGLWLSRPDIRKTVAAIKGLDHAGRVALPCIGESRADLILAGCAILDSIMMVCPATRLRVADRGLREGIITELIGRHAGAGA